MDFEDDMYEAPEWLERSDDYNVFEERQLDLDRDAGEYDLTTGEPDETLTSIVAGAVADREYDVHPPVWSDVVADIVRALEEAGVSLD